MKLSFPSFIGIVSLAGIVVNNAIILIDRINENRKLKKSIDESIIDAGKTRLQPIFITSLTTIDGLLPLALSDEVWGGLGFAIIFGMCLSTVLVLVIVPSFYKVLVR